jgi:hypothetical protein
MNDGNAPTLHMWWEFKNENSNLTKRSMAKQNENINAMSGQDA